MWAQKRYNPLQENDETRHIYEDDEMLIPEMSDINTRIKQSFQKEARNEHVRKVIQKKINKLMKETNIKRNGVDELHLQSSSDHNLGRENQPTIGVRNDLSVVCQNKNCPLCFSQNVDPTKQGNPVDNFRVDKRLFAKIAREACEDYYRKNNLKQFHKKTTQCRFVDNKTEKCAEYPTDAKGYNSPDVFVCILSSPKSSTA